MKCKTFKISLSAKAENIEEAAFNRFLENVRVTQLFASVVGNEFWSIAVFYEEVYEDGAAQTFISIKEKTFSEPKSAENFQPAKNSPEKSNNVENVSAEPTVLTAEQEKSYTALRNWRNEQASENGLAPYMIAHNDSLMQIAILRVKSRDELLQVRGFGEKRAEKYGDEILRVLSESE